MDTSSWCKKLFAVSVLVFVSNMCFNNCSARPVKRATDEMNSTESNETEVIGSFTNGSWIQIVEIPWVGNQEYQYYYSNDYGYDTVDDYYYVDNWAVTAVKMCWWWFTYF